MLTIEQAAVIATARIMGSISKQGLTPSDLIDHHTSQPLRITFSNTVNRSICVNSVDLKEASVEEIEAVINTLVEEEFCGLLGIASERAWPYESVADIQLLASEMTERFSNSMVFILKPPHQEKKQERVELDSCSNRVKLYPGVLRFYESQDNLSADSARGGLLTTPFENSIFDPNPRHRLMEIKTSHVFRMSEVLAILVPEHLAAMASRYFPGQIIPVPTKAITIARMQAMNKVSHDQDISRPLEVHAPNYSEALRCLTYKRFSTHLVRLPTRFDFALLPVQNVDRHSMLLQAVKAIEFIRFNHNTDAWMLVSKLYGVDLPKMFLDIANRLTKQIPEIASNFYESAISAEIFQRGYYVALSQTMGTYKLLSLNLKKSDPFVLNILKGRNDIHLLPHPNDSNQYFIFYDAHKLGAFVKAAIDGKLIQNSSALLSRIAAGFWTRKQLGTVSHMTQQVSKTARELQVAQERHQSAQTKLEAVRATFRI